MRRWTVEQAAEAYRVEPAQVRRMESGKANPSLAVLTSIASALSLPVSELLGAAIAPSIQRLASE